MMEDVVPSRMNNPTFFELNIDECNNENVDSEDETQVFSVKRRKLRLTNFLHDDSDDQDSDHGVVNLDLATTTTNGPCENDGDVVDNEEGTEKESIKTKKKKKIIRPVEDSDDDDDADEEKDNEEVKICVEETLIPIKEGLVLLAEARSAKIKSLKSNREKEDEKHDTDDISAEKETRYETKRLLNDDLYDAEGSSDEDRRVDDDPDDEGLEDIKKRAKKTLKTKNSRPKRENLQQLHSESQRLVRQGRVNLPYHVPQHKTLDEFLNRRKSIPNTLKPAECELENILKGLEGPKDPLNVAVSSEKGLVRWKLVIDPQPVKEDLNEVKEVANDVTPELEQLPCDVQMETSVNEELPDLDCNLLAKESPLQVGNTKTICTNDDLDPSNLTNETTIQNETIEATNPPSIVEGEEEVVKEISNVSFSLKQRLSFLGNEIKAFKPKLAGAPQEIICLDEDGDGGDGGVSSENSGLCDLMKRFVKHTLLQKRQKPVENKEVVLNILKKEVDNNGIEQLKMESVKVNSKLIEDPVPDDATPGSRLKLLRETLKAQLALKREEARKQRLRLHEIDNEQEGDRSQSDNESCKEDEEEEEILSDLTDTEESEPDDEEIEQSINLPEKRKKRSEFVDDEAEDEDGISDDGNDDDKQEKEDNECINLSLEKDALDDVLETEPMRQQSLELFPLSQSSLSVQKTEPSLNRSLDGSFEIISTAIPSHQPGGGLLHNNQLDFVSQPKLSYPMEDSQFLFSQPENSSCEQTNELQSFDLFQFPSIDTQSNSSQLRPSMSKKLGFEESQNDTDEVFDLCSGKWPDSKDKDLGVAQLCDSQSQNTQENEAELLGLCSGKFSSLPISDYLLSTNSKTQNVYKLNNTQTSFAERTISDDELSISSLQSVTISSRKKKKVKRVISDSESETDMEGEEKADEEDESEAEHKKEKVAANEFFEDEAELSGSDVPSDEDEEINEEDDILEEELGDQDYISEDELRNQVEKVHNKLMLDEDQRQLRIYKELYLEDGELHTDGQGRTRRFRWKNVGDSQTEDGFKISDSEGEDVVEEVVDAEFRAQRHEREKWLTEQSMSLNHCDDVDGDDDVQFGKMTKKITILSRHNSQLSETPPVEQTSIKRLKILQRRGSFLSRSKEILAKIAEQTKSSDQKNPNGPRNSKNFVFAVISPTKSDSKPAQLRRSCSTPGSMLPAAKRPRLDKRNSLLGNQSQDSNSIFDLL